MSHTSHKPLFGGSRAWNADQWTSSDDRVRGGSSLSNLTCSPGSPVAQFHGYLDISALGGGAGFASQRTAREAGGWDVSAYDGVELRLDLGSSDRKTYTLILKDEVLPQRPDGRERSTLNWEYDFCVDADRSGREFARWDVFRATYRGKPVDDARPLNLRGIQQFSIMARSFFGRQEGEFTLGVVSIAALRMERYLDDPDGEKISVLDEKGNALDSRENESWLEWLAGCARLFW